MDDIIKNDIYFINTNLMRYLKNYQFIFKKKKLNKKRRFNYFLWNWI